MTTFMMAFSGQGSGTVWLEQIGPGQLGLPATLSAAGPLLDPYRELEGYGVRQRRDAELIPEDPLVLAWLKANQDSTTPDQKLLGSMEDHCLQTFNNALVAMAFILDGEKERAERILDFFAQATDRQNTDPTRQNFFLNGEARGFFQNALLKSENGQLVYRADGASDRWMGDMAWLMFAYKHYDQVYGEGRYTEIEKLIVDLLVSWYKPSPDGHGGYLQSGWRKGDVQLHEAGGHPEGNIDAYALFKLLGDEERAANIRQWLDHILQGDTLPLDLYTWRVLAYGPESALLLNIPDYDQRFRKTVPFNGRDVVGVFHSADPSVQNLWIDGIGHMACAYFAVGNIERGNFYANQLDLLRIDRTLGGVACRGIPYVANQTAGFQGFRSDMGFVSPAAWYIMAKHRFNPMTLKTAP